jgi:uncharacterized SAM-binding protein YcdF (DUF218 family)
MKHKFLIKSLIFPQGRLRKLWRLLQNTALGLGLILLAWFISTTITLVSASSHPVDAFFVLGGSIRREVYVAQLAKQFPHIPILISQGSPDPCVWLIFKRESADLENVWLEHCARSTFDNFYYSIPILQHWGVQKVRLITSGNHLLRAKIMAQILLGAHGIWVEPDIVQERGVPGNKEFWLKTLLDVIRSFLWAVFSQVIYPQCSQVAKLIDVDIQTWEQRGFKCEHQGNLGKYS